MALFGHSQHKKPRLIELRDNAQQVVVCELRSFVSARIVEHPAGERLFRRARNSTYAYFQAATECIERSIDKQLADYKVAVESLSLDGYLRMIATLNTGWIVSDYLAVRELEGARTKLYVCAEAVVEAYHYPESDMVAWIDALGYLSESKERQNVRLGMRVSHEIADVLRLSKLEATLSASSWCEVAIDAGILMNEMCERTDWNTIVESDLGIA